jgi:hypothetical protein
MPIPDQFIHRYLEPYYESFCRLCTKQAGMAKEETGLLQHETDHVCDPYLVDRLTKHGMDLDKRAEFIRRLYKISN